MRFMILIKANKDSEAGVMPSERLLTEMGKFNEELVQAGVMLAGEGLHPTSKGARVRFSGGKRTVIDGPFAETKELIAGFWIWHVNQRKRRSSGSSAAPIPITKRLRSKFARYSRPRTSEPNLRRNFVGKKPAFAPRPWDSEHPDLSIPRRSFSPV